MTARSIVLALTCAATLAPLSATVAHADAWRFVTQYTTLTTCNTAGKAYVARHRAREYKCENDYNEAGDPALDLYLR